MAARRTVSIFGSGLAGLTASIHLARGGNNVDVFEAQPRIGGDPNWHPSVQTTMLDQKRTWDYLGFDCSQRFHPVEQVIFYRYGRKNIFTPEHMFHCEGGLRGRSLDGSLYRLACNEGVNFHFSSPLPVDFLRSENTIIATGLSHNTFSALGIPHQMICGYRTVIPTDRNGVLISHMEPFTGFDLAYLSGNNGLLFSLLFSRKPITEENREELHWVLA